MQSRKIDPTFLSNILSSIKTISGLDNMYIEEISKLPPNQIIGINDVCRESVKRKFNIHNKCQDLKLSSGKSLFESFIDANFDFYDLLSFIRGES